MSRSSDSSVKETCLVQKSGLGLPVYSSLCPSVLRTLSSALPSAHGSVLHHRFRVSRGGCSASVAGQLSEDAALPGGLLWSGPRALGSSFLSPALKGCRLQPRRPGDRFPLHREAVRAQSGPTWWPELPRPFGFLLHHMISLFISVSGCSLMPGMFAHLPCLALLQEVAPHSISQSAHH